MLKGIEKSLRSFFWFGTELKSTGAKVSWADVCAPKEEGGLGFRVLKDWNRAVMTKHLWAIALKADTLWVKWIHTYIIKDHCLWSMAILGFASWTIRKLFNLRSLVQPWITYVIGNGSKTFLWSDNWHPLGPLYTKFGTRIVYNLGRNLYAKVASIVANHDWKWPRCRNSITRKIIQHTPASLIPHIDQEDTVRWNLSANGQFSIQSVWNAIRRQRPHVSWGKVVWFKHVPRWAIIQWLAILGRLSTLDRLQKWGIVASAQCVLYSTTLKTCEHLFFQCSYSSQLWQNIQRRNRSLYPLLDMAHIIDWLEKHASGSLFGGLLSKLSFAALLYYVWGERNMRIFQHHISSLLQLEAQISTNIRVCASSWRSIKKTDVNLALCVVWNIPHRVFDRA